MNAGQMLSDRIAQCSRIKTALKTREWKIGTVEIAGLENAVSGICGRHVFDVKNIIRPSTAARCVVVTITEPSNHPTCLKDIHFYF